MLSKRAHPLPAKFIVHDARSRKLEPSPGRNVMYDKICWKRTNSLVEMKAGENDSVKIQHVHQFQTTFFFFQLIFE